MKVNKKQVDSVDKSYLSKVKSRVEKQNRPTFSATRCNGQLVISGSRGIVTIAESERKTMTLDSFLKTIGDDAQPYDNKYYETSPFPVFPKMDKKFKSKTWIYSDARNYLTKLMAIVGFGKSNSNGLQYGKGRPPAWWPSESVPWEAFGKKGGPGKVGIVEGNLAIESILQYYNIDPYEYFEMHEEETAVQSSRHNAKRIPKSNPLVDYEDSEDSDESLSTSVLDRIEEAENVGTGTPTVLFNMNKKNRPAANSNQGKESDSDSSDTVPYDDGSESGDLDEDEETGGLVAGAGDTALSDYEKVRENNIRERREMLRTLGITSAAAQDDAESDNN